MAFDDQLMYRSSGDGNLSSNESAGPVTHRDTGVRGMGVRITVPSSTEASAEIAAKVYVSDDNSTYTVAAQLEGGYQAPGTGGAEYYIPLSTKKKYSKVELLVSGTTTNFGAVRAGLVAEQRGLDRSVNFE